MLRVRCDRAALRRACRSPLGRARRKGGGGRRLAIVTASGGLRLSADLREYGGRGEIPMERSSAARPHPLGLVPPGTVINTMKGDADERRAGGWLEWDGTLEDLKAALLGIPFDGASVVRTGSRGGADAVRRGMMWFTTYSTSDGRAMDAFRAAD